MPEPDSFARRVLRELDRQGMTITELAEATGIERTKLSRWLNGKRDIRLGEALKAAGAVGVECARG